MFSSTVLFTKTGGSPDLAYGPAPLILKQLFPRSLLSLFLMLEDRIKPSVLFWHIFFFSISFSPPLLLSIFFFLENWIAFSFKNVFWVKRPITQQLLHNLQIGALVVPRQLCFASFFYSQHSSLCIQTLVYLMCRQCCLTTCMLTLDPILLNNYIRTGPFILDITECR